MADQQPPEASRTAREPTEARSERTRQDGRQAEPRGRAAGAAFEIADTVIAKIAYMACREIDGVHALGGATSRALSSLRVRRHSARRA